MLSSLAPAGLTMPERPDLFWPHEFAPGGRVTWHASESELSTHKARQRFRALLDSRSGPDTLAALSAMDAWGIFTGHHAALMTGNKAFIGRSKVLTELLELGVLDLGAPHAWDAHKSKTRYYRRSMAGPLGRLTSVMTPEELHAVRGDTAVWSIPSGHDRHDVLALDLGMRVAEYHREYVGVLGEKHSKAMDMRSHLGEKYHHRGDATLVRDDGLRLVLELTSSRTQFLQEKIERWARWMNQNPLQRTGVMVLFVAAPSPVKRSAATLRQVQTLVERGFRSEFGKQKGSTRLRVGVVEWREWLDAPGSMTPAFEDLTIWITRRAGQWEQYPLAGAEYDLDYTPPVDNLLKTHGPAWIK